ncbi:HAD family hydrolase [Neolewinella agarilytica]|uniref:phosphoglycolate phosphatase n=1 Tax=Neolewinella agarilytica TaxID=478744 RepID=A0A1H9LZK0_9BACT|nr:HAD hydrolase-like protein [Neolewinella agarilytica]SER16820.1 Phosphoglycolate phosphatase, HAD superfamily [Neolewinella agarilytica]
MKRVNVVVTDLDNTLWDWLRMWHASFEPYLNRISSEFSIPLPELKKDFRNLHKRYGTSESSYVYKELTSLTEEQKSKVDVRNAKGMSILHEYYHLKKNNLELYSGVYETLLKLKKHGVLVIAFTESNAFFTKQRLEHLKLDGLIDFVYSPIDNGKPTSVDRFYPEDHWEPKHTQFRYLSKGTLKPAPEILEIILKDFNASKQNTLYIGDKLDKDVSMAIDADVFSIHAAYGSNTDSKIYELLKEVSHWTDEDILREAKYNKDNGDNPIPSLRLEKSFEEILDHFEFFPFDEINYHENVSHVITIWQKTIDVQQHFNDIELRIRNIALTTFTFIIGAIGFLIKEGFSVKISELEIPLSTGVAVTGLFIMFAFFYMDRAWYHKLLIGAVKQGIYIEDRWAHKLPEMRLTHAIGKESPHSFYKDKKIHSRNKYYVFYGLLFLTLIIIAIISYFLDPVSSTLNDR